jgi:hypothetical protein
VKLARLLPPLAIALLAPRSAFPQAAAGAPPRGYVMQVEVSERWMNARQRPRFTTRTTYRDDLYLDSVHGGPSAGGRTLFVSVGTRGDGGVYVHDASGRAVRVNGWLHHEPRSPGETPEDSASADDWRLFGAFGEHGLALPSARLWDLVPTFPTHAPRRGETWSDSLELRAEHARYRQALSGRRVSRVEKDTVVRGRRLWIVRDSAAVRYADRELHDERTLAARVAAEHEASGVIRGRHLFDPRLRLFLVRHDTTALAGRAVLRYPDGRAFPTAARFERARTWTLLDPASLARRERARDAAREDEGSSVMRIFEKGGIETRLIDGDRRLRDSLVRAWRQARDPDERARIIGPLEEFGSDPADWLAGMALEDGDTAYAVRDVAPRFYGIAREPVNERQLRWVLPFMDDPGLAFAFGVDRDPPYENLVQALVMHPPAVTPNSGVWSCTRAACALLARQRAEGREPRLRDVGLVAALALEPARWADTVLARAAASPRLLAPAAQLVRGALTAVRDREGPPLPPSGAGWRAWQAWMAGSSPDTRMFEQPHQVVIRFHEALTGRDIVGELRRGRDQAVEDSARLVYGVLLLAFGEATRTPAELQAALRNGSPAERTLATQEAVRLLDAAPHADSATVTEVLGPMLARMIDGAPPWRWLEPATAPRPAVRRVSEGPHPLYISSEPLSAALRVAWSPRARLIEPGGAGAPGSRDAAIVYTASPVRRAGPFVRLNVRWSTTEARRPDQEPFAYSGGASVDLVQIDGEWRVINAGEWIT